MLPLRTCVTRAAQHRHTHWRIRNGGPDGSGGWAAKWLAGELNSGQRTPAMTGRDVHASSVDAVTFSGAVAS